MSSDKNKKLFHNTVRDCQQNMLWVACEAYLRKRGRSSNAGEVPDLSPKLSEMIDSPLAESLIVFELYAVLLLNECFEVISPRILWTVVLPELFMHRSRHPCLEVSNGNPAFDIEICCISGSVIRNQQQPVGCGRVAKW